MKQACTLSIVEHKLNPKLKHLENNKNRLNSILADYAPAKLNNKVILEHIAH